MAKWLDKYDKAQDGEVITSYLRGLKGIDKKAPLTKEEINQALSKSKPVVASNTREKAEAKREKYNKEQKRKTKEAEDERVSERKSAVNAIDKGDKFTLPSGEVKKYEDMDWREKAYVSGKALEQRGRINEDRETWYDDFANPLNLVGSLASGIGKAPYMAKQTNSNLPYVGAVAAPLLTGALGSIGAANTKQFLNNVGNPLVGTTDILKTSLRKGVDTFHPIGVRLRQIEREGLEKGLSEQAIKNMQMQEVGITSLQREGYFPGVSEILSEYLVPYSYDNAKKRVLEIPKKIIKGDKNSKRLADLMNVIMDQGNNTLSKPRYDAWRLYSGLPQKHRTFRMAQTSPLNHPSYRTGQLDNIEKFSLNNEKTLLNNLPNDYDTMRYHYYDNNELLDSVDELKQSLQDIKNLKEKDVDFQLSDFNTTNVMGGYNRRFFDNKMEYNDVWDLDLNGTKVEKYYGKPFMSHGQLDYSFEPAENAISALLNKVSRLEKNINKNKRSYDIDYNINNYKQIPNLKNEVVSKKKSGGSVESTMDGLTDKGFNYNGAWGGQFAMGGSLPGATGMMYARTGAPSNGKYAKKTKASAQNGQEMKFYQEGLDFKPKTISQDGTEIPFDPNGYWNPENWGKPVNIPSNIITMEGVDQPLIGISNTGDVQYMEPGEDYEFDGNYVTEYPVARGGISVNQADAQPVKKLDQLLNFTNYNKPTKGGWLDKYN